MLFLYFLAWTARYMPFSLKIFGLLHIIYDKVYIGLIFKDKRIENNAKVLTVDNGALPQTIINSALLNTYCVCVDELTVHK